MVPIAILAATAVLLVLAFLPGYHPPDSSEGRFLIDTRSQRASRGRRAQLIEPPIQRIVALLFQ